MQEELKGKEKIWIRLEQFTQTFPESNATNANFIWTNNSWSLFDTNLDQLPKINYRFYYFMDKIKSHVLCKYISVWKIVNDGISKTLVSALPSGTVWVDERSPFVLSWVVNLSRHCSSIHYSLCITCPSNTVQTINSQDLHFKQLQAIRLLLKTKYTLLLTIQLFDKERYSWSG